MSSIMSYVAVFMFVLLDFGWAIQTNSSANLTCDQLPKLQFPNIKEFIANSPIKVDYALTTQFDCSTLLFSTPERGTNDYTGNAVFIKGGGSKVSVLQYTVNSNDTAARVKFCSKGQNFIWYFGHSHFDEENGSFYCAYVCDGPALQEMLCMSNNNATNPQEPEFVALARQVPSGDRIHWARNINCTADDCSNF